MTENFQKSLWIEEFLRKEAELLLIILAHAFLALVLALAFKGMQFIARKLFPPDSDHLRNISRFEHGFYFAAFVFLGFGTLAKLAGHLVHAVFGAWAL